MGSRTLRRRARPAACAAVAFCGLLLSGRAAAEPLPGERRPAALTVGFGGLRFVDEDLRHTYGSLSLLSVRLAKQVDERAEFFCGVQYGRGTGNPFYGTPDFRLEKESTLEIVPLDLGVRLNAASHPHYRFYFGFALRRLWVQEEVPFGESYDVGSTARHSGWGWGLIFLGGPEMLLAGGRTAFGVEAAFGLQSISIEGRSGDRDADFSGIEIRGYASILVGADRRGR